VKLVADPIEHEFVDALDLDLSGLSRSPENCQIRDSEARSAESRPLELKLALMELSSRSVPAGSTPRVQCHHLPAPKHDWQM
jgi:hypothetical protein